MFQYDKLTPDFDQCTICLLFLLKSLQGHFVISGKKSFMYAWSLSKWLAALYEQLRRIDAIFYGLIWVICELSDIWLIWKNDDDSTKNYKHFISKTSILHFVIRTTVLVCKSQDIFTNILILWSRKVTLSWPLNVLLNQKSWICNKVTLF